MPHFQPLMFAGETLYYYCAICENGRQQKYMFQFLHFSRVFLPTGD